MLATIYERIHTLDSHDADEFYILVSRILFHCL